MLAASITDVGKLRISNQDRFICDRDRGLFAVCDGMGGHNGGEEAATIAVDVIEGCLRADCADHAVMPFLAEAMAQANEAIWKEAQAHPELSNMGTTAAVALVRGNHLYVASVGDSPVFLLRAGQIKKLTRDHTLANQMVEEGLIQPGDDQHQRLSHVLTRALGVEPMINVDFMEMSLLPRDELILTSDGLTGLVTDQEIAALLEVHQENLSSALQGLCDMALARGGFDNITIVAVRLPGI
jgi:protein phosphatase